MFLEIGFSRGKNAGTVVAKIWTNFSIAALLYWAVGFAFAFGGDLGHVIGNTGFFLRDYGDPQTAFPIMGFSDATIEAKWLFQFAFCAVSLAIVWGTTLERIKFGVYIIYAVVFSALIYPIFSGWVFGGGWLQVNVGMQDFAGSTAVHLIGATGGLAVLLLLGARKGKYGPDGKPRAIPGHNMPLFGLSVGILLIGWFGFNPGSTLNALDTRFAEVALVTLLAAAAGVLGAVATTYVITKNDRHRHGRQRHDRRARRDHGALGLRRPVGRRGDRPDRGHHRPDRRLRDRQEARRSGRCADRARSVRCLGHALVWPVHAAGAGGVQHRRRGRSGLHGLVRASSATRRSASSSCSRGVFITSYATFWVIKKTYGLRVTEEEEFQGLDISEHGMYGYPEQFIPAPELVGYGAAPQYGGAPEHVAATSKEVTA